jgi:hypothetical protein
VATSWRKRRQAAGRVKVRAGTVLEFVNEFVNARLEEKNDQEMRQNRGSGGTLVWTRRSLQTDHARQAFESERDAPAWAIEGQNVGRGETLGVARGHQDHSIPRRRAFLILI